MKTVPFQALVCPLDGAPLQLSGNSWQCTQGHSFDRAKQGYVNLLPVQNKRSRDPGDSKAMVAARQRFLDTGAYQPLADAMADAILPSADDMAPAQLACLDAGSGEGYYLRQLADRADNETGNPGELALLGLDISKWAILSAARQDKRPAWVVGTNARLPVQDHSLDWVLCVFGFPVYPEYARVLKPGGKLLQADPGPEHLKALRSVIYPTLSTAQDDMETKADPAGFQTLSTQSLSFPFHLDSQAAIADLLTMTPHGYRASEQGRNALAALTQLNDTANVTLKVLQRI